TEDGAGPISSHAVRDPDHTGTINMFIERQTPHLNGLGALQLLAEEMTVELQGQVAAARTAGQATATLQSKGVSFGTFNIAAGTTGAQPGLLGISPDLVVRAFQWKDSVVTVRDFVRGAGHNEIGMQGQELTGIGVDGDSDGVADELTIG